MIGVVFSLFIISMLYIGIGRCKGIADTIQHSADYRENGWKAKWKLDKYGEPVLNRGKMVERFLFSSTLLVWYTDKWHMVNFIQYRIQDSITWFIVYRITDSWWSLIALLILPALRYIGFKQTYRNP